MAQWNAPVVIDEVERTEQGMTVGLYDTFIGLHKDTLRSLDLQNMGRWSAMSSCWTEDHNGNPRGISCLPVMHKLRDLTIELGTLLRSPRYCGSTDLGDILPPNLENLVLVERWRPACNHHLCQADCPVGYNTLRYARQFLKMICWFARTQPLALPRLRRLTLVCNRAWELAPPGGTPQTPDVVFMDPAVLRVCEGGRWKGWDLYNNNPVQDSYRWGSASVSGRFAENGVAFEIGVLEQGKYYAPNVEEFEKY